MILEKRQQQAESVDDDASAFGFELNFHDNTLTAANESQIFQNHQIQIGAFQVHQQRKKTSREKMKHFLENRHNKKIEKRLSKEQKVETSEEEKFQEKLHERMEHQDKKFNKTMYGLQRNMTHLTQTVSEAFIMMSQAMNLGSFSTPIPVTPRQDFPNFPMIPRFISPMIPSSDFGYSEGLTNNSGNNSSSKNDLLGKTDDYTENQNTYFSP